MVLLVARSSSLVIILFSWQTTCFGRVEMQCLSMPHIRCFRKSGWRERWKTHRILVPRSKILPVFHQSAPLFGSVLGIYRFILLRFLCFRWVANRGSFKESTQVFIGKMRKKGLKNEKIKLLSVTLFSFSRFSRERKIFYMMKKSRRWEEWRKRVAGATGYDGDAISVCTDCLL